MRFKKILIIPLLFFIYIWFMSALANPSIISTVSQSKGEEVPGAEVIGMGSAVTVQVIRAKNPYLFGLVNLPRYIDGIGNVGSFHTMFFYFLGILTATFVVMEWRSYGRNVKWQKKKR